LVNISGRPAPVDGAPVGGDYAELHEGFDRLTRSDIAASLARLAGQLRSGRYPAGRPYRHVNGFTKIVLSEHAATRVTLHYWPAAPGPEDVSRPHDHRFAFSSILLSGTQHFEELEETADPGTGDPGAADAEPWRCYEYRPFLQGRIATVTARGRVGLRPVRTVWRTPLAERYRTSAEVVHRAVTNRDSACVTLVLRKARERRTSRVFYGPDEPPPRGGLQFGRRIDHDEVVRQVDHAVSLVNTM
jgi:hypothetical protein